MKMESSNLSARELCSLYLGRIVVKRIDSFLTSVNADSRSAKSFYAVLENLCRLTESNFLFIKSNEKR